MIKRIILSLLIIAGVSGSAVLGTQALLSDTVSLTTNTFSTGTVDLQIALDSTGWLETTTGFSGTIRPGQTKSYFVWLRNNTPDLTLGISGRANPVTGSISSTKVTVAFTEVDAAGVVNGDTVTKLLSTWDNVTPSAFGTTFDLTAGASQRYRMDVSIASDVTGGDKNFDFIFTGTQANP